MLFNITLYSTTGLSGLSLNPKPYTSGLGFRGSFLKWVFGFWGRGSDIFDMACEGLLKAVRVKTAGFPENPINHYDRDYC